MNRFNHVFEEIMTAQEASIALGKNEKYIYSLWKNDSPILLEKSVALKGATLLITKEGYEHLIPLAKERGRPSKKLE